MFKNLSLFKKIFFPLIIIAFVSTIIFLFTSINAYLELKKIIIEKQRKGIATYFYNFLDSQKESVLTGAILLANNLEIRKAMANQNRTLAYKFSDEVSKLFYREIEKKIKIEIAAPDLSTFLQSWNINRYGDSLLSLKKHLQYVKKTKKVISTIDIGEKGLSVRGAAPVIGEKNNLLGIIEVIIDFDEIIKKFPSDKYKIILLSPSGIAKKMGLSNNISRGFSKENFVLSVNPNLVDLGLLKDIKNLSLKDILFKKAFITEKMFIVVCPISDYFKNILAYAFIGIDKKIISSEINEAKISILKQIIAISISSILLFSVIFSIFFFEISKPIVELTRKIETIDPSSPDAIEINRKDEIGRLANFFNIYLHKINDLLGREKKLNQFRKLVEDDNSLEDVYRRVEHLFDNHFKIKKYVLFEVNPSGNHLIPVIDKINDFNIDPELMSNADLCRAKKLGTIVSSDDSFFDKICYRFKENKHHICIPLITGEGVKNILLLVADSEEEFKHIKELVNEIKTYLNNLSPVLETKRLLLLLKKESITDTLTGFYNRRFLDSYLVKTVALANRMGSKIGILMIDIDFFKKVNDEYGHDIGDMVLQSIAKIILKEIRESDIAVRFGGEEFLVVLNNVENAKRVEEVAERIRGAVEKNIINAKGFEIKKTISIGFSIYPEDAKEIWKVIKFADVALYEAKRTGRNKVLKFKKEMWQEEEW